jgi:hypothetical protein
MSSVVEGLSISDSEIENGGQYRRIATYIVKLGQEGYSTVQRARKAYKEGQCPLISSSQGAMA